MFHNGMVTINIKYSGNLYFITAKRSMYIHSYRNDCPLVIILLLDVARHTVGTGVCSVTVRRFAVARIIVFHSPGWSWRAESKPASLMIYTVSMGA